MWWEMILNSPIARVAGGTAARRCILAADSNHHLYADDTQLYMSFSAIGFCYNNFHLGKTISLVHNWISSNSLSLDPSKIEFKIIGLSKQLAKPNHLIICLHNSDTLSPADSALTWVSFFYSTLSFSEQIYAISKFCFNHIRDMRHHRNSVD
jgi:hypothetical protein